MTTTLLLANVIAICKWKNTNANGGIDAKENETFGDETEFNIGSDDNEVDTMFRRSATLAASGSVSFDLTAAIADRYGNNVTFDKIKAILITCESAVDGDKLNVGGSLIEAAFDLPAAQDISCYGGGRILQTRPLTGGSNGVITIEADAGNSDDVDYQLTIFGVAP